MSERKKIEAAVRAGCEKWQHPRWRCGFPECDCRHIPAGFAAAIRAYLVASGYGLYTLAEFDAAVAEMQKIGGDANV